MQASIILKTSAPEEGPLPRTHPLSMSIPRQLTSMRLRSTVTTVMIKAIQWCHRARILDFRASLAPIFTFCNKAKAIREWLHQSSRFVVMHRWLWWLHLLERMISWSLPHRSIWQKGVVALEQRAGSMQQINQKSRAWWKPLKIWLSKKKVHLSSQSLHSLRTRPLVNP